MAEKLSFERLYFRESTSKRGEKCFVAKIREYTQSETGEKEYKGDAIVIANTSGKYKTTIDEEGKWDVSVMPMNKGKGYVVLLANRATDKIQIKEVEDRVLVLVNGREEKLKTEDGHFIPISFFCEQWYDPKKIINTIKRKMEYLQLGEGFDKEEFFAFFLDACSRVEREYAKKKAENSSLDESDLSRLRNKFKR